MIRKDKSRINLDLLIRLKKSARIVMFEYTGDEHICVIETLCFDLNDSENITYLFERLSRL